MLKKSLTVLVLLTCFSCGPLVLVPPELDLTPFERVGMITFVLEDAEGRLSEMATQRFVQEITFHQRGVQIIELGTLKEVLGKINKETLDQDTITAVGEHFGVTSFFLGEMVVSDVKPKVNLSTLVQSMRIQANFNISMTARLVSSETGATLWTDSIIKKGNVAYMSIHKGHIPYFDLRDQDEAYLELVEHVVHDLTRDFRPTKRRM